MTRYWRVPVGGPPSVVAASVSVHLPESLRERTYRFPSFWTLHIYRHAGEIRIGEERFEVKPGYASMIAPDTVHHYTFVGRAEHAYLFLRFPEGAGETRVVPVVQELGPRFLAMDQALREAIAWAPTEPVRASARAWDLVWQLVDEDTQEVADGALAQGTHPAVRKACEWMELNMQQTVTLEGLAGEAGVSAAHLARLFTKELGVTALDYLRRRRANLAGMLLRHSTLPIKAIAGEVGIADLHQFNKMVRRELGDSPRAYRKARPELAITYQVVGREGREERYKGPRYKG